LTVQAGVAVFVMLAPAAEPSLAQEPGTVIQVVVDLADPPTLPRRSGRDPGEPAGTLTVWVVRDWRPVSSVPIEITLLRAEGRTSLSVQTGPGGYVRLVGIPSSGLRGLIVDSPEAGTELVRFGTDGGQVVVLRIPLGPFEDRPKADPGFGVMLDVTLGTSFSTALGRTDDSAPFSGGLWLLMRRRWLQAGVGLDAAGNVNGPAHQFMGGALGARFEPLDVLVEAGVHAIDVSSSMYVDDTHYAARPVLLPYLGLRGGLSWRCYRCRHLVFGFWTALRFDLVREPTTVAISGTRETPEDDICIFSCTEDYYTETGWNLGGASFLLGFRIGLVAP